MKQPELINEAEVFKQLQTVEQNEDSVCVRKILSRAGELKGLQSRDVEVLTPVQNPDLFSELFHTTRGTKEAIYGPRIVLFVPLYISSLCRNDCLRCGFRATNREVLRHVTLALVFSRIPAGSRTNPGGYKGGVRNRSAQLQLGNQRSPDEVLLDLAETGYIPSYCTACCRPDRTGQYFRELAKPGDIEFRCATNAPSTFLEYLIDYAPHETGQAGEKRISTELGMMNGRRRATASKMRGQARAERRDVYI